MEFEWDEEKDAANLKKHGLNFYAATRVFNDPWAIEEEDRSAIGEQRFNRLGLSGDRLIVVTYTFRGDTCRIISARKAEAYERRRYHET